MLTVNAGSDALGGVKRCGILIDLEFLMTDHSGLKVSNTFPPAFSGMYYIDFMAELSRKRETRNYLEVGVHFGDTLCRIASDTAVGVDPAFMLSKDVTAEKRRTILMRCTSDRFFAEHDVHSLFGGGIDLAFLDGLHQFEVLLRDFYNTEANSTKNGLIVMHDCLPLNLEMTNRNSEAPRSDIYKGMWAGDVWKMIPILRQYRPDLKIVLVDCPPTGLVCVTGLNPDSRELSENYLEIVQAYQNMPDKTAELSKMYAESNIVRSTDVVHAFDHSMYFKV